MEVVERQMLSNDWITGVILLSLVCLVFSKSFFYNRFMSFIILPFNNKFVFLYSKKGRLLSGFHLALTIFQLLNISLFAYLGSLALYGEDRWGTWFIFPVILVAILIFTLVKVALQYLGGTIFNTEPLIASIVFKKFTYLNYSALILFVANLLLAYLVPLSRPVVIAAGILALCVNGIGWINVLKIHQKYIASHFFYFILYLCALEIAPFLILSGMLKA